MNALCPVCVQVHPLAEVMDEIFVPDAEDRLKALLGEPTLSSAGSPLTRRDFERALGVVDRERLIREEFDLAAS